jgi:myosin-1
MTDKHKLDSLFEKYKRDLKAESLDDLIVLKEPTDTNITDVLKNRYKENSIYTYLGSTVVSVNPYKKTPHYSSEVVNYFHFQKPYSIAPHLYSLAEDAFRTMKETGIGQVIIISGESGAGKTEVCVHWLTTNNEN